MKYGYIRVSDIGPTVEEQTRLLLAEGCDRLFTDITREGKSSRDAWEDLLKLVKAGDAIVVARLDRFEYPLKQLIELLITLADQSVDLISLAEKINSQDKSYGYLINSYKSLLAFDSLRTTEKTKLNLRSARARGKLGGRPRKLDPSRAAMAKSLYKDKKHSIEDICDILKVSRATFYRYLA